MKTVAASAIARAPGKTAMSAAVTEATVTSISTAEARSGQKRLPANAPGSRRIPCGSVSLLG